jgi:hypothetical protein
MKSEDSDRLALWWVSHVRAHSWWNMAVNRLYVFCPFAAAVIDQQGEETA